MLNFTIFQGNLFENFLADEISKSLCSTSELQWNGIWASRGGKEASQPAGQPIKQLINQPTDKPNQPTNQTNQASKAKQISQAKQASQQANQAKLPSHIKQASKWANQANQVSYATSLPKASAIKREKRSLTKQSKWFTWAPDQANQAKRQNDVKLWDQAMKQKIKQIEQACT